MITIIESGSRAWAVAATDGDLHIYSREQAEEWNEVSLSEDSEQIDQDGSLILEALYEQQAGHKGQETEEVEAEAAGDDEEPEEDEPEELEAEAERDDEEPEEDEPEDDQPPQAEEEADEPEDEEQRPRRRRAKTPSSRGKSRARAK